MFQHKFVPSSKSPSESLNITSVKISVARFASMFQTLEVLRNSISAISSRETLRKAQNIFKLHLVFPFSLRKFSISAFLLRHKDKYSLWIFYWDEYFPGFPFRLWFRLFSLPISSHHHSTVKPKIFVILSLFWKNDDFKFHLMTFSFFVP